MSAFFNKWRLSWNSCRHFLILELVSFSCRTRLHFLQLEMGLWVQIGTYKYLKSISCSGCRQFTKQQELKKRPSYTLNEKWILCAEQSLFNKKKYLRFLHFMSNIIVILDWDINITKNKFYKPISVTCNGESFHFKGLRENGKY